jgi:hypothetical protein
MSVIALKPKIAGKWMSFSWTAPEIGNNTWLDFRATRRNSETRKAGRPLRGLLDSSYAAIIAEKILL